MIYHSTLIFILTEMTLARKKTFIIIMAFLAFWSLNGAVCHAGFLTRFFGADKELQAENDKLTADVERLNGELQEARGKISDLEAKVEELRRELEERDSFVKEENKKSILVMRKMETENKSLRDQVASSNAKKGSSKGPGEKEDDKTPGLFKKNQCVKWFGTVYERTHAMSGRIERVNSDKSNPSKGIKYVVRCTETTMPHYWAVGHAYEFEEIYLHACN